MEIDMEKDLSKLGTPLTIRSIKEAAEEETKYIDDRRKGLIQSISTPWKKYNNVSMGGIEWYTLHTIAGMSGSGKTAILNQLETHIAMEHDDINILSFNFEMLARNLVGRKYSKATGLTMQQVHSGMDNYSLSDTDFQRVKEAQKEVQNLPIYYVDEAGTVVQVLDTIVKFAQANPDKGLIVTLDHTLLVNGKGGELERIILTDLVKGFKQAMKWAKGMGIKLAYVVLSQLNRQIEESERLAEPGSQNFPKKKDIFGGDALFQMSDVVMVSMNPMQIGLDVYGPNKWPTKGRLYWHFLKVREGEPTIAVMVNKLGINTVEDLDLKKLDLSSN